MWKDDAACRGDRRFIGDEPDRLVARQLAAICARCPVATDCLSAARRDRVQWGWWAGRWWGPPSSRIVKTCPACGVEHQERGMRCRACTMRSRRASIRHGLAGYAAGCDCGICVGADTFATLRANWPPARKTSP